MLFACNFCFLSLKAKPNACVIKGSAGQKGEPGTTGESGPQGQKGKTRMPV